MQDVKKEFNVTDDQFKQFQEVAESNEGIENLAHRRLHRKLERTKRQNELKIDSPGKDNCSQQ